MVDSAFRELTPSHRQHDSTTKPGASGLPATTARRPRRRPEAPAGRTRRRNPPGTWAGLHRVGHRQPTPCLRAALAGFARAQMPTKVARSRLELANALLTTRTEVAMQR
jgi:hypothetical protein